MFPIVAGRKRGGKGIFQNNSAGKEGGGEGRKARRIVREESPAYGAGAAAPKAPRLFDQVRGVLRFHHYSIRTEEAYLGWIRRFILFHGKRHPNELGAEEVRAFLTALAVEGKVAAPTQND